MRLQLWLISGLLLFGACRPRTADTQQNSTLKNGHYLDTISHLSSNIATVLTFLGPECPLSENYTKTLNDLQDQFSASGIRFIAIFPGTHYTESAIDSFMHVYHVQQEVYLDKDQSWVKRCHATITPETFIFDTDGKLVYSGAIDNWAVDLGQKRQVITEFYVRDVLEAMIAHQPVPYTKTQAVGCFIEENTHAHH